MTYLNESVYLLGQMSQQSTLPFFNPAACNGILWQLDGENALQTNTITNSLFFAATARLAKYWPQANIYNMTASAWAHYMYNWFFTGTTYPGGGPNPLWDANRKLFYDTIDYTDNDCSRLEADGGSRLFTYNQAVVLTALVDMWQITSNTTYLSVAADIANASIAYFGTPTADCAVVFTEPAADHPTSQDQVMFKGILARKLGYVKRFLPDVQPYIDNALECQLLSILARDLHPINAGNVSFGFDWTGASPTQAEDYPVSATSSGIQALVAFYM